MCSRVIFSFSFTVLVASCIWSFNLKLRYHRIISQALEVAAWTWYSTIIQLFDFSLTNVIKSSLPSWWFLALPLNDHIHVCLINIFVALNVVLFVIFQISTSVLQPHVTMVVSALMESTDMYVTVYQDLLGYNVQQVSIQYVLYLLLLASKKRQ